MAAAVIALLDSLFRATAEGLALAGFKEAHKYTDQWVDIMLELTDEIGKGYNSDDAKVEALYQKAQILAEAMKNEVSKLSHSTKS